METICLDGNSLTLSLIDEIAHRRVKVTLAPAAQRRIATARSLVDGWVNSDRTIYGVTTGFGEFSNVLIDRKDVEQLGRNRILH